MPPKGTGALPFGPCANLNCSNNLCHPIQCYCKGTDGNLNVHSFLDPRCTRNSKFGKLRVDGPPGSGCRPRVIDMTQRQLDYGRQLARNAGQDGSDGRKDTGSKTGWWQKVPNKGMRRWRWRRRRWKSARRGPESANASAAHQRARPESMRP